MKLSINKELDLRKEQNKLSLNLNKMIGINKVKWNFNKKILIINLCQHLEGIQQDKDMIE